MPRVRGGWTVMMVLASIVSVYAALVLVVPGFGPPFVAARRAVVPWAVIAHIAGSLTALAVGPWQFSRRIRARAIHVHRWLGRAYVVSVFVGGAGALALAPMSQEMCAASGMPKTCDNSRQLLICYLLDRWQGGA
jgi:hypothetical protein